MAKRMVHLIFPQRLIKKPVIYSMAKRCDVVPNIRRAKITETVGEVVLELEAPKDRLDQGVAYLKKAGVRVEPVVGDIVES